MYVINAGRSVLMFYRGLYDIRSHIEERSVVHVYPGSYASQLLRKEVKYFFPGKCKARRYVNYGGRDESIPFVSHMRSKL